MLIHFFLSRMDYNSLCLYTTLTQNRSVCCFMSGWATTTGRLLGPKIA